MRFDLLKPVKMEEAGGDGGTGGGGESGGDAGTGDAGNAGGDWRESLDEDLRGSDIGSLAKSYVETKALQGSSIRIPGEDAGEDAVKEFNNKLIEKVPGVILKPNFDDETQSTEFFRALGMPETADGYELPEIEVPEGVSIDNERMEGLKAVAHKHGLTAKQFNSMMNDVLQSDIEGQVAVVKAAKESQIALKNEWGLAYDDNMASALRVAEATHAPEGLIAAMKAGELGPETAKWLHGMAAAFKGEGSQFGDDNGGGNAKMTPAEAQAKISEIMDNKQHPYWNPSNPGNKAALERMIELQKFAHPTAGTEMPKVGFGT
jgi:hypothetical protein